MKYSNAFSQLASSLPVVQFTPFIFSHYMSPLNKLKDTDYLPKNAIDQSRKKNRKKDDLLKFLPPQDPGLWSPSNKE